MIKKISAAVIIVVALTACGNKELYSWYDYEEESYEYSKTLTEKSRKKLIKQYEKMIDKQSETRGVVPPGLYAEYGYLLYKLNQQEDGIGYLRKEIALYPESETYISRIIKQLEQ